MDETDGRRDTGDDGRSPGTGTADSGRWGGVDTDVRVSTEQVRAELRDMWRTRPSRPRENRKIAGVAAAIADRYDVDPILVRIGFVVAAFYGPGIPLYLAGCAALPDAGSSHRPGRGAAVVATVLVGAAAAVSALVLFGAEGRWFLPMLACLGLLAGLHLTRGRRGDAGPPAGEHPATGPDAPTVAVHDPDPAAATTSIAAPDGPTSALDPDHPAASDVTSPVAGAAAPTPPSWDPLGAAPFAWDLPDLPEPAPEPAPPPRPASRITPITLGIALVAAGIVAVLALTAPGALSATAVPATALAVVGVGLMIGAFRHAGRWLIPFAVVLAAVTWLVAAVPWPDLRDGVGDVQAAPRTVAELAPEYRRGAGDITLDLRGMDLTAAPGVPVTPASTSVRLGAGTVTVLIPRDADLVARGHVGVGDLALDGRVSDGAPAATTVTDPGPDGPGGRPIELDLRAEAGSLEVTRG